MYGVNLQRIWEYISMQMVTVICLKVTSISFVTLIWHNTRHLSLFSQLFFVQDT